MLPTELSSLLRKAEFPGPRLGPGLIPSELYPVADREETELDRDRDREANDARDDRESTDSARDNLPLLSAL